MTASCCVHPFVIGSDLCHYPGRFRFDFRFVYTPKIIDQKQSHDTFLRVLPRLLPSAVRFRSDLVEKRHNSFGAPVVDCNSRFLPICRDSLLQSDFPVRIDALHRITEQTQTELVWMLRLKGEEGINQVFLCVLAFVDSHSTSAERELARWPLCEDFILKGVTDE